jgi:hypothetical protein
MPAELHHPAVIAAAGAVVAWFLLLLAMIFRTRVPDIAPGPRTAELGPESPAVVDYVTAGGRLSDEAASATLLDLAARGVLRIEEVGPELSLVRLRATDPPEVATLRTYERMVYDHVRTLARDDVVATGALAEGARDLGQWWRRFRKAVLGEARAAGLFTPRWSKPQTSLLSAAAFVPAVLVWVAASQVTTATGDNGEDDPRFAFAFGALIALWAIVGTLRGNRPTERGRQVIAAWLGVRDHLAGNQRLGEVPAAAVTVWGRHLAYAAALGLAGRAVASLPVSVAADAQRAWSDYGGLWHRVAVGYPRPRSSALVHLFRLRCRPPVQVLFAALVVGFVVFVFPGILLRFLLPAFGIPEAVARLAQLGVALLVAGPPLLRAVIDLANTTTIDGQVVRLRTTGFETFSNDKKGLDHWMALDEGHRGEVTARGLPGELYDRLAEGDVVRVSIAAKTGWIYTGQVLQPSRYRAERSRPAAPA